jgi:hypothetical protein
MCTTLCVRFEFRLPDSQRPPNLTAGVRLVPREEVDLIRRNASIVVLLAVSRASDRRDWHRVRPEHETAMRQGG